MRTSQDGRFELGRVPFGALELAAVNADRHHRASTPVVVRASTMQGVTLAFSL